MPFPTTIETCDTNPANNGPAGSDLPATLDDAIRQAFAFIAQLRDGRGLPIGSIIQLPTTGAPTGFVKLNGQLLSRTTYANLFAFASGIGLVSEAAWSAGQFGAFSVGDGATNFRIPDLRAMFMRGLDESRGLDAGRVIGIWQDSLVLNHTHPIPDPGHTHGASDAGHGHSGVTDNIGAHVHDQAYPAFTGITVGAGSFGNLTSGGSVTVQTAGNGAHQHNLTINTGYANIVVSGAFTGISATGNNSGGGAENRVRNMAYPYYMRY